MRVRRGLCMGAGIVLLLGAGCARTQPCRIIPMQLKLAQAEADAYQKQVLEKQADVDRLANSLGMATTRLQQLREEEAELQRLIEAAKADSAQKKEGK